MNAPSKKPVAGPTVEQVIEQMDTARTNNLRIWTALGKTDPKHTKQFSRAGGFKGTAIKPIWITQRLTELFGPCGIGWGMDRPTFQVVEAAGEILVYCTVAGWYRDDAAPKPAATDIFPEDTGKRCVYGVGGDKVVSKRQSGAFCDDEAFKKAFTDALGNAFKFIGVGADVHMGLFEDSKYLAEVAAAFSPAAENCITQDQCDDLTALAQEVGADMKRFCSYLKIDDLKALPADRYNAAVEALKAKRKEPAHA